MSSASEPATQPDLVRVDCCNGKYTVIHSGEHGLYALRYGEPWRDLCGDSLVLALASDLKEARTRAAKLQKLVGEAVAAPAPPSSKAGEDFQPRVLPWMIECFGPIIPFDKTERNHRFLEEALELVQACGCTQDEAHQLVEYVYGRDQGDINQEVGGVMVTLAGLCIANGFDMRTAGETELARVWTKVEQIRAKQAAKPKPALSRSEAPVAWISPVGLEELKAGRSATISNVAGLWQNEVAIYASPPSQPDTAVREALEPLVHAMAGVPSGYVDGRPFANVSNDARTKGTMTTITYGQIRTILRAALPPDAGDRGGPEQ